MKKYKVGYTDGTYDLFHVGHLNMIETAKSYCDYLIVAVHGDTVVKEDKPMSPIIGEEDRRRLVASIKGVDQAEITRFRDKRKLWELYHFDVIFVGDDWKGTERWKRFEKELAEVGVDVIYVPYTRGISTTEIKKRIENVDNVLNRVDTFFIDLDGTLLDSNRLLPEKNKTALQEAAKDGKRLIISTGSPYSLIPFSLLEGVPISYALTANGSGVYDFKSGECVYECCMDDDEISDIADFISKKDVHVDFFAGGKAYSVESKKEVIDRLGSSKARCDYLKNSRIWMEHPESYFKENGIHMQKITINFCENQDGTLKDYEEIYDYVSKFPDIKLTTGYHHNLELTHINVDKGETLKILCKKIGIVPEQTMAIGDSMNDFEIVQAAGFGVAMRNACGDLKRVADYVTEDNNHSGVAQAIYKMKERNNNL